MIETIALTKAFLHGARFDLSAIALSNSVVYLFYLLPLPSRYLKWQDRLSIFACTSINGMLLAVSVSDIEYYRFAGKRVTWNSFAITRDIGGQFFQIASYYWYFSGLIMFCLVALAWLNWRILKRKQSEKPGRMLLSILGLIAMTTLAARGGWQNKPIIPAHAYAGESANLGILVLNSPFTLMKSANEGSLQAIAWLEPNQAKAILKKYDLGSLLRMDHPPKNVILIILESFGSEYVFPPAGKTSYTPFLQSLASRGSSFNNAFANGRRSIDAMPAIFAGIPSWMEDPFITSPYQTNQVLGFPALLKQRGYHTQFFHGGDNGTMFFDIMADRFGFQQYTGQKQYPDQGDHDGRWGIFDEPFLQYAVQQLTEAQQPFFAGIFTLSSHHPYTIPKNYQGRFPKGELEIHESLGYADYSLEQFYKSAQKQAWFRDTLFIFTADHTQKSQFAEYETLLGHFRVPLIFIQDDKPLPFLDMQQVAQHADILPTVLDALQLPNLTEKSFGRSLLRPNHRPGVILFEAPRFGLLGPKELIEWNIDTDKLSSYQWQQDSLLNHPSKEQPGQESLDYLKANIQSYYNGMINNSLILRN